MASNRTEHCREREEERRANTGHKDSFHMGSDVRFNRTEICNHGFKVVMV